MPVGITPVIGPRATSRCGGARFAVTWQPRRRNGFIVQHVTFTFGDLTCRGRPLSRPRTVDYYEAWQVVNGRVFAGYRPTPFPRGFVGHDLFFLADRGRSRGTNRIRGRVRFLTRINRRQFRPGSVPFAGILPASRRPPRGWTDRGAARHELSVTWNCCRRRRPRPTVVGVPRRRRPPRPPGRGRAGRARDPVSRILWQMPAWADLDPDDRRSFRRLRRSLNRLARFPLPEIRTGIVDYLDVIEREELELTVGRASRIFVLNRFLFDMPPKKSLASVRVFGGWAIPQDEEAADMSYPFVTTRGGQVRLTGRFGGYFGGPYDGLAEFDYLMGNTPTRASIRG